MKEPEVTADTVRSFATLAEAESYVNGYREAVSEFLYPRHSTSLAEYPSQPRGDGFVIIVICVYLWALWKLTGE